MKKLLLLSIAFVAVQADTRSDTGRIPIKPGGWMGHGPVIIDPLYIKLGDDYILDPMRLNAALDKVYKTAPNANKIIGDPAQLNQTITIDDASMLQRNKVFVKGVANLPTKGKIVCNSNQKGVTCDSVIAEWRPSYDQSCPRFQWDCQIVNS